MGHNYAKPARADGRLAQLTARVPADWGVSISRPPHAGWTVTLQKPNGDSGSSAAQPSLLEAWEHVWRVVGPRD